MYHVLRLLHVRGGLVLLALTLLFLAHALPAGAQNNVIRVTANSASHDFSKELKFELKAESAAGDIQRAELFYTWAIGQATNRIPGELTPGKSVTAVASKRVQQGEFPPQLTFQYYWRITDSAGNSLKTDTQTFVYADQRFNWQKVGNNRATVFWYDQPEAFGREYLQWTIEGLDRIETNFGAKMTNPINVVIYRNKEDMSKAITPRGEVFDRGATVLGIALSSFGTLVMLNQADTKVTLWHEITHLVLHNLVKGPYESNLPAWLDEGLAMVNQESGAESSYRRALDDAIRNDRVFSVRSMTSANGDPARVGVWYGQAWSIVEYLLKTQGKEKLATLLETLGRGSRTDDAMRKVYGFDQDALNDQWRQSVGLKPMGAPAPQQPAPQQPAPAGTATPRPAQATPVPVPPQPQAAQPTVAPASPPSAPAQPAPATTTGPSRTGLFVLAALVIVMICSTVLLAGLGLGALVWMTRRR